MPEIVSNQNLSSHYSTNAKTEKKSNTVAFAPNSLPRAHLFSDKDANLKLNAINQDIYEDSKKEKGRQFNDFLKYFLGLFAVIVLIKGCHRFFKKS